MEVELRGAADKHHPVRSNREFGDEFQSLDPGGAAMSVVVFAAPFRVECNLISGEPDAGIMVPQPRDAEGEGVVAELRNKEECVLHMVSDLELGANEVSNHTGGYRSPTYNF